MVEIDPAYAYKVYANSRKIHESISKALKKRGYDVDYRYQGALKTYSNILLYGDVEIRFGRHTADYWSHYDRGKIRTGDIVCLAGAGDRRTLKGDPFQELSCAMH